MDTRIKIIEASIHIFSEKGYLGTSTKAVAESAGVSEMTLFRKFKTKKNLFESMLRYTLGNGLFDNSQIDMSLDLYNFVKQLLHQRLIMVSNNIKIVQMIIKESLAGRLTSEFNLIETMSTKLKETLRLYQKMNQVNDVEPYSDFILSTIIKYSVIDYMQNYGSLSEEEQSKYLLKCISVIHKG
jgi:AcrR family transcriptional regulator